MLQITHTLVHEEPNMHKGYINEMKTPASWRRFCACTYIHNLGVNEILSERGEALAEPLLSPVSRANQQTEPVVAQLVRQLDAHAAVASQH